MSYKCDQSYKEKRLRLCDGKRHLLFAGEGDQRCKKWGEISLEQRANEEGIHEERSYRHSDGEMGTASRHQRHLAERGGWPRCHKANAQGQQPSGDPAGGLGTAECDGSGAGKIQRPGNTPRMEAFSLPATSPPEEAAELACVIPGWRVNPSRDEGFRRRGGNWGRP